MFAIRSHQAAATREIDGLKIQLHAFLPPQPLFSLVTMTEGCCWGDEEMLKLNTHRQHKNRNYRQTMCNFRVSARIPNC